jgi:hypothetical protein
MFQVTFGGTVVGDDFATVDAAWDAVEAAFEGVRPARTDWVPVRAARRRPQQGSVGMVVPTRFGMIVIQRES